jgi:disulfide bond formation protein DsbB
MAVTTVTLIYGLLALVGIVILVWLGVLFVVSRVSDTASVGLDDVRDRLAPFALAGAAIVALLAMTGSLYFSEVAHYTPCLLCWYQRIAMYPLVLLLGIAAVRRDLGIRLYAIPLAAIGAAISTYHYLLEWFPALDTGACVVGVPCTQVWFRQFGFVSLPFLALVAFLLVIAFLLVPFRRVPGDENPAEVAPG